MAIPMTCRFDTFVSDQRQLLIDGAGYHMSLTALAPDILRVRVGRSPLASRTSWAVIKSDWADTRAGLSETPEALTFTTGGVVPGLQVTLRKGDLHMTIATANGAPILVDAVPGVEFSPAGTSAVKMLAPDARIYGLGQRMGFLNKRGEITTQWATDDPLHHPGRDAMYQAIPFYLALQRAGAYGLLLDSPACTRFDLGKSHPERVRFQIAEDELDYYVIVAATPKEVLIRYTELTGRMPLPPKWSLGYHQSRWSYYPESRVREIANTFRAKQIPCDVIHLDIDYMDGYRVFTWDRERFPNPEQLLSDLKAMGIRVVTIVDPGVKVDPDYRIYQEGVARGYFATMTTSEVYVGRVWPGEAAFPDFLQAGTRRWWGEQHAEFLTLGVAGFWNDMNEPANFTEPEVTGPFKGTVPGDVLQGEPGSKQPHALVHNLYGQTMAAATVEGLTAQRPHERPFLLTRSGYAGIQRYAAVWMGDNNSWWEHLLQTMPTCLGMGLSGVAFIGTDCGGFSGDASAELLVRWTQMGAFTPFFRNHAAAGTRDQEPWAFDAETEALVADAIRLRYRFLPYIYTVFAEAHRTGLPIMRPLMLEYPGDPHTHNLCDQYLLGADLLVAPVYQPGATKRMVYLPSGNWVDYWTGTLHAGRQHIVTDAPLDRIPLFVRQGAILPLGPVVQHSGEPAAELTFDIFGSGSTEVYEDDGISTAYMQGVWSLTRVTSIVGTAETIVEVDPIVGSYRPPRTRVNLRLRGRGIPRNVTVNGQLVSWEKVGRDLLIDIQIHDVGSRLVVRVAH